MIAVTALPSATPSSSAASTVIEETRRWPLASISTFAVAGPLVTETTLPLIWFRALIGIAPGYLWPTCN